MVTLPRLQLAVVSLVGVLALVGCSSSTSSPSTGNPASSTAHSSSGNPKLARAQALADQGNAAALELIRQTTKPFEGCSRPNYFATVGTGVTGRRLAADELAFFVQRTPLDQGNCSAFLYVFHAGQSTTGGNGYTAGAVIDDDHLLEVHVGGLVSGPFATYNYG